MSHQTPAAGTPEARLFRQAAREPILGDEEERELARRAEAGDVDAGRRLVSSHLRMVIRIARAYRGSGLPMADLVQEGAIGLIHAVRRFNPDKGVRLSTYAMWWVRAAIQDHVMHSWSMVRIGTSNAQKGLFLRLRQATAELLGGPEDLGEELAARLARSFDTTAAEVRALARRVALGDQSLDQVGEDAAGRDGRSRLERMASADPNPEESLVAASESRFLGDLVDRALAMLPPREALIIRKRYLEEARQTFEAIGREIGLSKDRVRQLEAHALEKLRDILRPSLAGRCF